MEPSIMRYGNDKKKKKRKGKLFTGPCYLLPEQFYQPGDCEEKGWPDVTHIVASAFEGPGSPRGPEMGWLNRFSVFTAGPPLPTYASIWTGGLEFPQTEDEYFIKTIELSFYS